MAEDGGKGEKKVESPRYRERRYRRAGCPACTARVSCFSHRANHSPLRSLPVSPRLSRLSCLSCLLPRALLTPPPTSPTPLRARLPKKLACSTFTPPFTSFHILLFPPSLSFPPRSHRPFRSFPTFIPSLSLFSSSQPMRLSAREPNVSSNPSRTMVSLALVDPCFFPFSSRPTSRAQGASPSFVVSCDEEKGKKNLVSGEIHQEEYRPKGKAQGSLPPTTGETLFPLFARVFTHVDGTQGD